MARKHKARVAYRDKVTGRFVSRATWKRSKAHGGARFRRAVLGKRTPSKRSMRPKALPGPRLKDVEDREIYDDIEFQGAFDSPGSKK